MPVVFTDFSTQDALHVFDVISDLLLRGDIGSRKNVTV
jgi:hypothetical protein